MILISRKKIKDLICRNTENTLVNLFFKFIINNSQYVFCYHEISNQPSKFQKEYDLCVSEKNFENQIKILKKIFKANNKKILDQNFLITFDDGYSGSFNTGLKMCKKYSIKPIYFLNMYSVVFKKPILSALVIYLKKFSKEFGSFCKKNLIKEPEYIHIKPDQLSTFFDNYNCNFYDVLKYQGEVVDSQGLENLDKNNFFLASHLYKHYNIISLSNKNLNIYIDENAKLLKKHSNFLNFFAIPNGQPKLCFDANSLKILKSNFKYLFSSFGSNYKNNLLFDRIVLTNEDDNIEKIKTKILISYIKKIYFFKKLYL